MLMNLLKLAFVLSVLLQLSACGFHLRGDSQVADRFNPLYIELAQTDQAQLSLIRNQLKRSSVTISASAQGSNRLQVSLKTLKNRKIASSSLSDVDLVQLGMSIQFSVQAASGEYLIEQRELIQTAEVELDSTNVLGHQQIINKAQQNLRHKLIQNMVFNLSR